MNKERLLKVAQALRGSPNPNEFTMATYGHDCNTPACALGHYAARKDLQHDFKLSESGGLASRDDERNMFLFPDSRTVLGHFDITREQAYELFGDTPLDWCVDDDADEPTEWGCGSATTAIEAARYIEDFVAREGK